MARTRGNMFRNKDFLMDSLRKITLNILNRESRNNNKIMRNNKRIEFTIDINFVMLFENKNIYSINFNRKFSNTILDTHFIMPDIRSSTLNAERVLSITYLGYFERELLQQKRFQKF